MCTGAVHEWSTSMLRCIWSMLICWLLVHGPMAACLSSSPAPTPCPSPKTNPANQKLYQMNQSLGSCLTGWSGWFKVLCHMFLCEQIGARQRTKNHSFTGLRPWASPWRLCGACFLFFWLTKWLSPCYSTKPISIMYLFWTDVAYNVCIRWSDVLSSNVGLLLHPLHFMQAKVLHGVLPRSVPVVLISNDAACKTVLPSPKCLPTRFLGVQHSQRACEGCVSHISAKS